MQKTLIIGHLGKEAEVKEVNGKQFVSFTLADSNKRKTATGEIIDSVTWYECTMNLTNVLPYLKKGTKVFLRGNIAPKMYVGHDGQKHAGINLFVTEIELAGGRETAMKDVKDFILTQPEARQEIYDYLITFADQNQENEVQSESRSTSRGGKAGK